MSNIQTGAERMPHDLSHLGFLAGQIGRLITISDRKSGSAGMPRPISYAVFCLKKKSGNPRQRLIAFMEVVMKFFAALAYAAAIGSTGTAYAQEPFPQKGVIEITVLIPAGSPADVTARQLADGLPRQLGANVLLGNRPVA